MPSRRRFLSAAGTGTAAVLAGCTGIDSAAYSPGTDTESEWPMPAYDRSYTAYNPDAAAPRDGVTERWSTPIRHPSGRPVVAAGTVLVPTMAALLALDLETGEERWRFGGEQPWPTTPVVHDGTAYVGFADETGLSALDVETGTEQWRVETTGTVGAPPTFGHGNDRLYVGDDVGTVYLIDLSDGAVRIRDEVFGSVSAVAHHLTPIFATESGEVYGLYDHHNEFAGRWRQKVDGMVTALTVRENLIYAATFGGPTYCLTDDRVGTTRWEAERGPIDLATTGADVVGTDGGGLQLFDARTGEAGWERDGAFDAAPAIAGDTIYVGGEVGSSFDENSRGFVAAYELGGGTGIGPLRFAGERWRHEVDSTVMEGIAVADGAVFAVTADVGDSRGRAYALDPA